jgi:hypothetical protein
MKYLTESQRLQRNLEFQSKLKIVTESPLPFGAEEFTANDAPRRLLAVHALEPGIGLTKSYERAGLGSESGGRTKKKLIADGMVKEHSIVHRGSGGHGEILELLPPALEVLKTMGVSPVDWIGRGEFLHAFYVNKYLVDWAKKNKFKYEIEKWMDGSTASKCIDFVYYDEYGRINGIEVFTSGELSVIVTAGVKCAMLKGVNSVCLALNDKEQLRKVKGILKGELLNIQEKLSVEYLNKFQVDESKGDDGNNREAKIEELR